MKVRVISAIAALCVFVPFILLGGTYFMLFIWLLGLIGMQEFCSMMKLNYQSYIGFISSLGLTAVLIPHYYWPSWVTTGMTQNVLYISMVALMTITVFDPERFNIEKAAVLVLAMFYLGLGFQTLIRMRDAGLSSLMFLFAIVWATDIGAYCVGRAIGKQALAPKISPNKTIEGAFGGTIIALIVGIIYLYTVQPPIAINQTNWFLIVAVSFIGQFGDLVESAMKRHFQVKDSGRLIPGHGGILDRFDSTLFASIILMLWVNFTR